MSNKFDVVGIGEILIDFSPMGLSPQGNAVFERNPGGAIPNVMAQLAKLGRSAAFIGMVGDDMFGECLRDTLVGVGVSIEGLKVTDKANTTLAFVALDQKGNRSFSFYRNPGADIMLTEQDVDEALIESSKLLHFGSLSMVNENYKKATLKAINVAKRAGIKISYDPNMRLNLWKSEKDCIEGMLIGLPYADILKISEEEVEIITGESDYIKGSQILFERYKTPLIFVTLGPKGAFYRCGSTTGFANTYDTKVVDTTGSGDAFFGGALYHLIDKTIEEISALTNAELDKITQFGNATGSMTATRKGGIPAVPTMEQVEKCIKEVPLLIL